MVICMCKIPVACWFLSLGYISKTEEPADATRNSQC